MPDVVQRELRRLEHPPRRNQGVEGHRRSDHPFGQQPPPDQFNTPFPNCIAIQTGVTAGQFQQALQARFASPCTTNHWPKPTATDLEVETFFGPIADGGHNFLNDPRYVTLVISDFTAFLGSGSSEPRPIKIFAGFYYTGSGSAFCTGDDPHPLGVTGQRARFDMWGHYVNIVEFTGQANPADPLCDFTSRDRNLHRRPGRMISCNNARTHVTLRTCRNRSSKERKPMSNTLTGKVSGRMSSRGWAIALGIGAIVLAAILLVVYLDRYRARVGGENAPTPVLVAKQYIPAGTPGTLVASGPMYAPTTLPRKEVEVGAISDPQYLSGRAASAEIFPGQQFTATDFATADTASVDSQITGVQRAISVSIDNVHGSLSQLQAGDSIDLYVALGGGGPGGQALVKLFKPNVKVLMVPASLARAAARTSFSGSRREKPPTSPTWRTTRRCTS